MTQQTWWNLDHHVWQELKKHGLNHKNVIVALSGGADSLALANLFVKVLGPEKVTLAHFHHGDSAENEKYRDHAFEFCRQFAWKKKRPFVFEKWIGAPLSSEAQCREKRYEFLLGLYQKNPQSLIVTGHQQNDVLETRLIRLIRGTGPQGLCAIRVYRAPFFRPLLKVSRKAINLYLNKEGLQPLVDPSNQQSSYLRNWIRNEWLPQLEKRQPGSRGNLGRSLESIVDDLALGKPHADLEVTDLIPRSQFLAQTESEQTRWLARAILHTGRKDFTQFHLQEIRKRLLGSPKINSFKVAGCEWHVNAQQIRVQLSV